METLNLGQVQALYSGATAPTNTSLIWYDTVNLVQKFYNGTSWEVLGNRGLLKDDGTFIVASPGHLTFDDSGSVPSIADVFILKVPSTVSNTVYIAINGEPELELLDTQNNNISSLVSGISYMIMRIDDLRDISSSESYSTSDISDVYVLVGQVSTDRRKIEHTISTIDIIDFDTIRLQKFFTLPRLLENLKITSIINTTIYTPSDKNLEAILHIFSDVISATQVDSFTNHGFKIDCNNYIWDGRNKSGDEFISTNQPMSFRNKDYTFVWLNASAVSKIGDVGEFDLKVEFSYPSKEQ